MTPSRALLTVLVVVFAAAGCASGSPHGAPNPRCCVRPPTPGQLYLQSYSFPVHGDTGSLNVLMGMAEPSGISVESAYLDSTKLTSAVPCGVHSMGTYSEYACTVSATLGPGFPAPSPGSSHTLKIVESPHATYTFTITAATRSRADR